MNIKVVTLEGCDKCRSFKEELTKANILYDFTTCEKNGEICDSLESATNSAHYPMVMLSKSNNEVFEIIFLAEKHSQLAEGAKSSGGITYIPMYSTDNILNYVKKRLNLNK